MSPTLAMALAAVLIACASASAAVTHPLLSRFNGSETPSGTLAEGPIAVAGSSGYVDVLNGNAVDEFTAAGKYVCEITGAGSASKSTSECDKAGAGVPEPSKFRPEFLAVDNSPGPSAGDVYVAWTEHSLETQNGVEEKVAHGVIARFSPSGAYLSEIITPTERLPAVYIEELGLEAITTNGSGDLWVLRRQGSKEAFDETLQSGEEEDRSFTEYDPEGKRLFQFAVSIGTFDNEFAADYGTYMYGGGAFGLQRNELAEDSEADERKLYATFVPIADASGAIGTDLATNDIYVTESNDIVEYAQSGTEIARFGTGGSRVAVDPRSGNVYVLKGGEVEVYGPALGPRAVLDEPSETQTRSLKLNAEVDPKGAQTNYQFEWGTGRGYGHTAPATPAAAGSGSAFLPVSTAISGLEPGTTYHYRIVASNGEGTVEGADATFSTKPIPTIDAASASEVQPTSALLNAKINPKGNPSSYRIEYGPSSEYGQSTEEAAIGSGEEGISVSRRVEGLSPNITYHWRVVVSYPEGAEGGHTYGVDHEFVYLTEGQGSTACANEALRWGPSRRLPECRAYELVTPAKKNGAVFGLGFAILPPSVSTSGSQMVASSIQPLAGSEGAAAARQAEGDPYLLTRTAGGWTVRPLAPAADKVRIASSWSANPETGAALFSGPTPPAGEDDFYVRQPSGSLVDVGPAYPSTFGAERLPIGPVAYTLDYSHILYDLQNGYGGVALRWPFDGTTIPIKGIPPPSLYEYVGTGNSEPQLVGVKGGPDSKRLISDCGTSAGAFSEGQYQGIISNDGQVVYFTAFGLHNSEWECPAGTSAPTTNQLYARIGSAETVAVSQRSPSECTTEACKGSAESDAEFVGASEDGSRVFFLDTQQLTDSAAQGAGSAVKGRCAQAGCNLYLYDFSEPEGHELIDVSAPESQGGVPPQVQGVTAISPDGSHVYFVAKGVLTSGVGPEAGADNLYVYERDDRYPAGRLAFVADLSSADSELWAQGRRRTNVTPDGRFLVFTSNADLTRDDHSARDAAQVFRYDADTEKLARVSIGERGFNDNGNTGHGSAEIARPVFRSNPTISDDGIHVFFQSPVGLTPQALNMVEIGKKTDGEPAYAQNVYEWTQDGGGECDQAEGCVYLISDGKDTASVGEGGESAVQLIGADATGDNVFFSTVDRLAPQDQDTELDYYDARVDGGFPTAATPVRCEGEACQGAASLPQPFGSLPSETFSGAGNFNPLVKPPRSKKLTRRQLLHHALQVCRRRDRRNARRRRQCVRAAYRRYGNSAARQKTRRQNRHRGSHHGAGRRP